LEYHINNYPPNRPGIFGKKLIVKGELIRMRKYLKKALGVFFIILGFLALITPCSPGSWLILVGLEFLGLGFLLEDKLPAFLRVGHNGRFKKLFKKTKSESSNKNNRQK
jgi:hypothetical protein